MKTLLYTSLLFLMLGLTACRKKVDGAMSVVKDCSGSYLRFNYKDYKVCNAQMLEKYQDGAVIRASFEKIKNCPTEQPKDETCNIEHENEGWVNIRSIEQSY